jgi:hypothetical protein
MTRIVRSVSLLVAIPAIASAIASTAYGHARLKNPAPRDNQDGYKDPPRAPPGTGAPCGISEAASQPHTTLTPGAALTVTWEETVTHPGCFVIDFSPANDANFQVIGRKSHANAPAPNPTTQNPRQWSVGVTLPSTPCAKCTLRLRQLMLATDVAESSLSTGCPPATIPAGSTYYSCANIVLGGGGSGGGGTTGSGGRGGTSGQAGTSGQGQAGTSGQGQAGTSGQGQAGTFGQGQAGTFGQAGTSGQGQAGTDGQGQAGTFGQAGASGQGEAGTNGSSGAAGTSGGGQAGTSGGGGGEATGGCQVAGGAPAPLALVLALALLRRARRRSRS